VSRARFSLLLAVLGVLVAAGAFAIAWSVLDDGRPDPPPRSSAGSGDALGSDPVVTPTSTTAPTGDAPLATPAWVAVVASEGDEATATTRAQAVAAAGYPGGVLRSDDYPSLSGGLWVAYTGPYPDRAAADAAVTALAGDGFDGAYARCVGSTEDCAADD
jgi:hypothetical protein